MFTSIKVSDGYKRVLGIDKSHDWIWIDGNDDLRKLVLELVEVEEIALDTEFHREKTYFPRLALMQIAWNGKTALLDPFSLDLTELAQLFQSPVTIVFHAGTQDLEILHRVVGCLPVSIFDTQLAAGFIGFSNPSLALLSERLLGISVPKGDRLTDWTKRPLVESQLRYAASDVSNLLDLKAEIERQLAEMGRTEWAWDESKILLEKDRQGVPLERLWWKIKECRHLKGDSRKVAQVLAGWREQRAARLDIPARYVLSDLAIAAISQEVPRSVAVMSSLRGVEQRYLGQGVDREILQVVSDALSMPDSDLCLPFADEGDKRLKPLANLATAWVAQLAQKLKIDPLILATRSDVALYLTGDRNSRLATGWRNEVLGVPLTQMAKGEIALAINASGELELEKRSFIPYA